MLIVRQTYKNRIKQTHAKINIKNVGLAPIPELLTTERLDEHLNQTLAFVTGTASTFLKWVKEFKVNHKNSLPLGDQKFFKQLAEILKFVIYMDIMTLIKMNACK